MYGGRVVMESKRQLRDEIERLRAEYSTVRSKLRQCASAYRSVTAELQQVRADLIREQARSASIHELSANHAAELTALVGKLAAALERGPETISESILSGLSTILNGYAQAAADSRDEALQTLSMNALGLDNEGGTERGAFFPDVEFDDWAGPLPTPGMMTSSPVSAGMDQMPVHQIDGNGRVHRMDGQPMFQAGTSGPPPVGGIE